MFSVPHLEMGLLCMADTGKLVLTSLLRRMEVEPISSPGTHCAILKISVDGCNGKEVDMNLTPYQALILSNHLTLVTDAFYEQGELS